MPVVKKAAKACVKALLLLLPIYLAIAEDRRSETSKGVSRCARQQFFVSQLTECRLVSSHVPKPEDQRSTCPLENGWPRSLRSWA